MQIRSASPLLLLLSLGLAGAPAHAQATARPATGSVLVTMTGFRSDRGAMRISLFRSAQGYPGKHTLALRSGTGRIQGGAASFRFDGIPHGTYAISVLHDENGNGKMDTNWIGIPKEGGGASNDAKARFGPPKYEDAKFVLAQPALKLAIKIRYP